MLFLWLTFGASFQRIDGVHRRTSDACRRRERWGIDGTERGLQGTTSSRHFGGYTGSHLPPSPAVQAVTTRTTTGGWEKSRTSVEHIHTNDLGLECRTKYVFKH